MPESLRVWAGIDVSKRCLDIYIRPSGEIVQEPNSEAGVRRIVEQLQEIQPDLVVLEATAGEKSILR